MTAATIVFALVYYAAAALLAGGLAYRVYQFAIAPAPLKIATTPAPTTAPGVALRMLREVALFESLFKASFTLWALGWVFHATLFLVLARHLRYFTEPVWTWVVWVQPFGIYAGIILVVAVGALWARRGLIARVRYISTLSDHLMLALLAGIGASGLSLRFLSHPDIVAVKAFFLGLIEFDWQPLPAHGPLYVHLGLVAVLMAIFAFSKLLHAPGIFFSPTRNQTDTPREKRHLSSWAAELEGK